MCFLNHGTPKKLWKPIFIFINPIYSATSILITLSVESIPEGCVQVTPRLLEPPPDPRQGKLQSKGDWGGEGTGEGGSREGTGEKRGLERRGKGTGEERRGDCRGEWTAERVGLQKEGTDGDCIRDSWHLRGLDVPW